MKQTIIAVICFLCVSSLYIQAQKINHPSLLYTPQRIQQVKQRMQHEPKLQEAWGDMQTFLEDSDWETTGSLYAIEDTISMKRGDDRIFSYVTTDYSYLGGAHPNFVYNGYNYDTKTGKRLTLRDVTEDYDSLYAQVLDTLRAFQEEQEDFMFFEDYEDTVKGMFYGFSAEEDLEDSDMTAADREETPDTAGTASDIDNIQWYLTDDELVVIFNRYDIAAYVFGPTAVKIPFETGLVKEIYS